MLAIENKFFSLTLELFNYFHSIFIHSLLFLSLLSPMFALLVLNINMLNLSFFRSSHGQDWPLYSGFMIDSWLWSALRETMRRRSHATGTWKRKERKKFPSFAQKRVFVCCFLTFPFLFFVDQLLLSFIAFFSMLILSTSTIQDLPKCSRHTRIVFFLHSERSDLL